MKKTGICNLLIIFLLLCLKLSAAPALLYYEVEDRLEELVLRLKFDEPVSFEAGEEKAKRRWNVFFPGCTSKYVKGRQDLDHVLAISFHVIKQQKGLRLLLYTRGDIPVTAKSLQNDTVVELVMENIYPTRTRLDPLDNRYVICIDPGHGFPDPGAEGKKSTEADINLLVGKALIKEINSRPGLVAFLTRDEDYKIKLEDRPKISDRADADLFISLHLNAFDGDDVHGYEVYYLSDEGASQSLNTKTRKLVAIENEGKIPEVVLQKKKSDMLNRIILDMQKDVTVNTSAMFAQSVAEKMSEVEVLSNRGVHRAAFVVLKTIKTPSILIELGFVTSKRDEDFYLSALGQVAVSRKIADGIEKFITEVKLPKKTATVKSMHVVKKIRIPSEPLKVDWYKIKPGDTLIKIAKHYKISYKKILTANPSVVPERIQVGQKLKIPIQ
jgi:N-acetylmuramoyl-L-alanine amidase